MEKAAAVVIGAGDALGGAVARAFADAGYIACPVRRKADQLKPLADAIVAAGHKVHPVGADARKEDEVIALFDAIERDVAPVEVCVFNVGAWYRESILTMSTRVFTKVWEMANLAGFLTGREAAKRMVARGRGTIIFTGATASMRGASEFGAFASAKSGLRALAQSMARELMPKNIHVAHVVVDGPIDTKFTRERFAERFAELPADGVMAPDDIARNYLMLHRQPRSAWTFELDVRPWVEKW
ncbi:MAG: SDR family NAD(P)-dependent oxidoreductase [Alphaproteobacteria bacterium]